MKPWSHNLKQLNTTIKTIWNKKKKRKNYVFLTNLLNTQKRKKMSSTKTDQRSNQISLRYPRNPTEASQKFEMRV